MTRERLVEILGADQDVGPDYGTGTFDITPGHIKAEALRTLLDEGLVKVSGTGDWNTTLEFKKG